MKKSLLVIVAFVLFSFLACSNSHEVSETQIEKDINQLKILQEGFVSNDYTKSEQYSVNKFIITKRQTNPDEKNDIIYCDVSMSNSFYKSEFSCKLTYVFYDQGGWILEESNILQKNTEPIAPIDKNCMPDISVEIKEKNYTLNKKHIHSILFDENNKASIIDYSYSDEKISFSGNFILYYNDDGWERINYNNIEEYWTVKNVNVLWDSNCYFGSYSGERGFTYPSIYGNGMGDVYYVKGAEKTIEEKYFSVQFPDDLNYELNITNISTEQKKIYGTITLSAKRYNSLYGGYANLEKDYTFDFESDFNTENGQFYIKTNIGVLAYQYYGYNDMRNVYYVPANISMGVKYSFSSEKWYVNSLVINSLETEDDCVICDYRTKWYNTH